MPTAAELRAAFEQLGVAKYADKAIAASHGAIRMIFNPEKKHVVGASRLGGLPDLPPGAVWPGYRDGRPFDFVAQIALADVAPHDRAKELPAKGWLWFFVLGNWKDEPGEPDYLSVSQVQFFDGRAKLAPAVLPSGYLRWWNGKQIAKPFKPQTIEFAPMLSIHDLKVPAADQDAVNAALMSYLSPDDGYKPNVISPAAEHHLLGVIDPGVTSFAPPKHRLLFQCNGHKPAEMSWGDAGFVNFFIPPAALKKRELAKVRSEYLG